MVPATSTSEFVVEETKPSDEQTTQPAQTQPQIYTFPILPNTQVIINIPFPETPKVMLYEQLAEEVLTPENALEMVQKLGVNGTVYQYGSEGNYTNYLVSDGHQFIYFNGSPTRFGYFDGKPVAHEPQESFLTPEQQVSIAQAFLQQAGLLDFPFRVNYIDTYPNEVVFTSLIDDIPVITENG